MDLSEKQKRESLKGSKIPWSREDDALLIRMWANVTVSIDVLANRFLRRYKTSVIRRAMKLKLGRRPKHAAYEESPATIFQLSERRDDRDFHLFLTLEAWESETSLVELCSKNRLRRKYVLKLFRENKGFGYEDERTN